MRLVSQSFTQELHCCALGNDGPPHVTITIHEGGGGPYLVLDATEWAMDMSDIIKFSRTLEQMLQDAEETTEGEYCGNLSGSMEDNHTVVEYKNE